VSHFKVVNVWSSPDSIPHVVTMTGLCYYVTTYQPILNDLIITF